MRDEVMGVVRSHFRPEFLNRVDEIILFHRLKRSEMGAIVDIQIARLQKLLDERKITLSSIEEARGWLAEKGYDPAYGARPLKRVIQKHVQDPLAELILSGEIRDGETVPVRLGPSGLTLGAHPAGREKRPGRGGAELEVPLKEARFCRLRLQKLVRSGNFQPWRASQPRKFQTNCDGCTRSGPRSARVVRLGR